MTSVVNAQKPNRPLPLALANTVGRLFRTKHCQDKRWCADTMMRDAQRKTGLNDFGDSNFVEPLRILMGSIQGEAKLTPIGGVIVRGRLAGILANRLRIEQAFAEHPEIAEQEIRAPIVIAGLQRTGTTMLHRLIAQDASIRSLASWEALNPAPKKKRWWQNGKEDPRVWDAKLAERGLACMAPEFFAIHPVEAHAPEEEVILLDYAFLSTSAEATMNVPTYAGWLEEQDQRSAYQTLKRMLQYLQWQRPAQRWVLKTPHHLEFLDALLDTFPDAKIVQTHRDPLKTVASFCSMVYHAHGIFSDEVDAQRIGKHWLRKIARMVDHGVNTRERRGDTQFMDVSYYDLMRDPVAEVQRIYDFAQLPWTESAAKSMQESRKENRQHKYGQHKYVLEDFGLDRDQVEQALGKYRARFSIPYE